MTGLPTSVLRRATRGARPAGLRLSRRGYNFASSSYAAAFDRTGIPEAGADFCDKLRADTVRYLEKFEPSSWAEAPVVTLLKGEALTGGKLEDTVDAFTGKNGKVVQATTEQVDAVIAHMLEYTPPKNDYRAEVRAMEAKIFDVLGGSPWPSFLVGNQALDFKKQDGVTEIEESVQANVVEQRLADQLIADEVAGKVAINRAPAYVGCVSNFSNFLDLCRKGLRNIELGVPIVVLSRSNTTQHMFRWTQMLVDMLPEHGIDAGMVTYLAAPRGEKARVFEAASRHSPMYFTCSREVARDLRAFHGPVMASTGGPNTLVATEYTPAVAAAIKLSATIENSGQCTALRHAVVQCDEADVSNMLSDVPVLASPADALRKGEFAGVYDFAGNVFDKVDGYKFHAQNGHVAYRHSPTLPPADIEEQWRNVYVDVTSPPSAVGDPTFVDDLSRWLVDHQPITLAVNAPDGDFDLAKALFEKTGQVVYTVGTLDQPALTCQARPQDGEVFGEFPVRRELREFTKFPVVVPTPTPAYNSTYSDSYLAAQGAGWSGAGTNAQAAAVAAAVGCDTVRGFLRVTAEYLADALAQNPKRGQGSARATLYGLQTTPRNGQLNYIRAGPSTTLDEVAPHLFPFALTTAWEQLRISVDPANTDLTSALSAAGIGSSTVVSEPASDFDARVSRETPYNVISPGMDEYPLVGQFVSLLFCVGHIKSAKSKDDAFIKAFESSPKWLATRA